MKLSFAEENYIKVIYYGCKENNLISTNDLAKSINNTAASTTEMLQKLHDKKLILYKKYHGSSITDLGKAHALCIIRKNLLWEVFLINKLKLGWEDVSSITEQLEHIDSLKLIDRLDEFLGHPRLSSNGKAIPNSNGEIIDSVSNVLTNIDIGHGGIIVAIKEESHQFLQYLSKRGIYIGAKIDIIDKNPFDGSMDISIDNLPKINISQKVADNLLLSS